MQKATRRYKIQDDVDFRAGIDRDGRQLLMGLQGGQVLVVGFDPAGCYLGIESKIPPVRPLSDLSNMRGFSRSVGSLMRRWRQEIGFQPGAIEVERFQVADRPVAIEDYPKFFREFLVDFDKCYISNCFKRNAEIEKSQTFEDIKNWKKNNQFVLIWGKEYWMKEDGSVEST